MTDLRDLIAETLAGHQFVVGRKVMRCDCGDWAFAYEVLGITEVAAEHRRHVADVLLAALGERVLPDDVPDKRQYGRRTANGLVLATSLPDPTHYRLNGPWRPVDSEETPT